MMNLEAVLEAGDPIAAGGGGGENGTDCRSYEGGVSRFILQATHIELVEHRLLQGSF